MAGGADRTRHRRLDIHAAYLAGGTGVGDSHDSLLPSDGTERLDVASLGFALPSGVGRDRTGGVGNPLAPERTTVFQVPGTHAGAGLDQGPCGALYRSERCGGGGTG